MDKKVPSSYVYKAVVESVYDGDTLTASLDLGLSIRVRAKCRLMGIDTPEMKSKVAGESKAAKSAKEKVESLVLGKLVTVQSFEKPDKYGRLLVKIWDEEGVCVNDVLIEGGFAQAYDGGTKTSWEFT